MGGKRKTASGADKEEAQFIRCSFCLRLLAVQSFSHRFYREATDSEPAEEPPAKVARQEKVNNSMRRCASVLHRSRTDMVDFEEFGKSGWSESLPPWSSFWTPSPKASCGGTSAPTADADKALFDPYAMHRFYCPFYSRADDDVGSFAPRVITSHHMVASSSAATAAATTENQEPSKQAVGFAAARAEELLRALGTILPPL